VGGGRGNLDVGGLEDGAAAAGVGVGEAAGGLALLVPVRGPGSVAPVEPGPPQRVAHDLKGLAPAHEAYTVPCLTQPAGAVAGGHPADRLGGRVPAPHPGAGLMTSDCWATPTGPSRSASSLRVRPMPSARQTDADCSRTHSP